MLKQRIDYMVKEYPVLLGKYVLAFRGFLQLLLRSQVTYLLVLIKLVLEQSIIRWISSALAY